MEPARSTRRLRWLALSATVASVVAPAFAGSAGVTVARGTTWTARQPVSHLGKAVLRDVVVQARPGSERAVAAAVRAAGGSVDRELPLVHGFSAHVPADAVAALRARPDVRAVTENSKVQFAQMTYDETTVASSFAKTAGAASAWATGNLGEGVGVAVIDTGISPMNDFSGRLVHGPDLSGEGSVVDNYGHGTVMAGLVGGSGADSAANSNGAYAGVAPKATLVSVKAAGRNGATDVSTMLQAMHWVSAYKDQFNIRVVNLSWGSQSTADPATDPLNYAVQRLWQQGIVVVVAAGNSGNAPGTVTKPADDPMVLTVGAYDDKGDTVLSNDAVPTWSSRGPTAQGVAKPDLVAPGRTVISSRSFGSEVERLNPKAHVPPSYIKGSGTSQSAAVVSGLAALLVKAHPEWTPDQVKAALRGTANPIGGLSANTQGTGRVNLAAALTANPPAVAQQVTAGTGLGPIEGSRGNSAHVWADCQQNGTWTEVRGEIDATCQPWNGASWTGASWTGASWTGASWTGASWTGASWTGASWTGASWTGASWTGGTWTGASWTGASWTGASWTGASWTGASWTGASWTGASWTGASWTGASWTSAEYGETDDGFLTAWWGNRPKHGHRVAGERSEHAHAARLASILD